MILCPCPKIVRDSTDSLTWQFPGNKQSLVPNSREKKRLRHLKYLLSGGEKRDFPVVLVVKNLPANAGDTETHKRHGFNPLAGTTPMAAHSSILAWRIPWTEKPGGLPSIGLQRVGHDWSDLAGRQEKRCLPKLFSSESTSSSLLKARQGTEGL